MLTNEEKAYLSKIDPSRKVSIYPFDPRGKDLGDEIIRKIKNNFPDLVLMH